MNHTIIYALVDAGTHEFRYIGRTRRSLDKRLAEHVYEALYGRTGITNDVKREWIGAQCRAGTPPLITPLETVPDDDARKAEARWIAKARRAVGDKLLNGTFAGPRWPTGQEHNGEPRAVSCRISYEAWRTLREHAVDQAITMGELASNLLEDAALRLADSDT